MRVDRQLLRSLTASHSFHLNAHMAQHMAPVSRATRRPLWALDNRMCGAFLGASCCLFRSHLLGSCTRQVTNFLLIPFFAFFSCLAAVANLPGEARWRHAHGPKWRQQLLLLCGFRSGFFLETLCSAAANKLTVKRNEREIKWTRNNQRVELSSIMESCGEASYANTTCIII